MNLDGLLSIFDKEQRQEIVFPDVRREVTPHLIRHIDRSLEAPKSWVVYSDLDESNVEAAIRGEIAYFEALGHNFEWKYYSHDRPTDLKERLVAHGFEIGQAEAVLVLDLQQIPSFLLDPVSHNIQRLNTPEKIKDLIIVMARVWDDNFDKIGAQLAQGLRDTPDLLSVYVAYAGEQPVSAAWLSFHPNSQFAGLWGGSTLTNYRRQGYYTALVATRAQEAIRRGVRFLTIDASPMSRPILQKYGFRLLTTTYPCEWHINNNQQSTQE